MIRSTTERASIDLGPGIDRDAEAILGWPDDFIGSLKGRLLAIRAGSEVSVGDLGELEARGLFDASTGHPTALGEQLTELVVRESWQEDSEPQTYREMAGADAVGAALEIGCSTGWALRSLGPASGGLRIGVDIDARALALGYRFSRLENLDCRFARCSALSLPVEDGAIDFIICRNTLTYVHQRAALREMNRVLKPDGRIFLRFENFWYDVMRASRSRSVGALASNLRDFGVGLVQAVAGWQPGEGSRIRWGRAFVAVPRLRRLLRDHGFEIAQIDAAWRCPRFWGLSTQTSILARRADVL